MRVVVLHDAVPAGARPDELDTLEQARAIGEALRGRGHQVETLELDLDLARARERLLALRPDLVFNLVESLGGQGRLAHLAPALLEALGLPYSGCSAEATFLASGKPLAKRLLRQAGIPTAPWLERAELASGAPIPGDEASGGRWIVKSAWEHASVGLDEDSVLASDDPARLLAELERRLPALGGEGFLEAFLPGRELNLGLLEGPTGPVHLPPAEIEFRDWPADKPRVVGYRAKWAEDSFEYVNTVRRYAFGQEDQAFLAAGQALARACWDLFRLSGYARVDLRGDARGEPLVLEVNTNPCLAPGAGYAAALEVAGIDYAAAIEQIARAGLRRAGRDPG